MHLLTRLVLGAVSKLASYDCVQTEQNLQRCTSTIILLVECEGEGVEGKPRSQAKPLSTNSLNPQMWVFVLRSRTVLQTVTSVSEKYQTTS
jgi:hypothetical protein